MTTTRGKAKTSDKSTVDEAYKQAIESGKVVPLGSFGLDWLEQSATSLGSLSVYYRHCLVVQAKLERKHKRLVRFRKWFDLAVLVFGIMSSLSGFATLVSFLSAFGIWTVTSSLVAMMAILRPYLNMDSLIERYLLGSSSYMRAAQEIDGLVERTGGYNEKSMHLFKEQALMLTQRVRELDSQFVDFLSGHKLGETT
jgi:hypothetical protein